MPLFLLRAISLNYFKHMRGRGLPVLSFNHLTLTFQFHYVVILSRTNISSLKKEKEIYLFGCVRSTLRMQDLHLFQHVESLVWHFNPQLWHMGSSSPTRIELPGPLHWERGVLANISS